MVNPGVEGGYKFLREPGADYVALLEAMLATFSETAPFDARRLFLFGFSGGGQFALRYALVEASRLAGLIVAAPGNVTLLDDALPWWAGTGGIDRALGRPLDRNGLRDLQVHLIVGADDLTDGVVERGPDDPYYSPHAGLAGPTRKARIAALQRSLEAAGIWTTLEVLDGVAHNFEPIAEAICAARPDAWRGWLKAPRSRFRAPSLPPCGGGPGVGGPT